MKTAMNNLIAVFALFFSTIVVAGTTYTDYGDWTYYKVSPQPDPFTDEVEPKKYRAEVDASYPGAGELIVSCTEGGDMEMIIETYGNLATDQKRIIFRVDKGDLWQASGTVPHSIYAPLDTTYSVFRFDQEEHDDMIRFLRSGQSVVFRLESQQYSYGKRLLVDNKFSLNGSSAALNSVLSECGV